VGCIIDGITIGVEQKITRGGIGSDCAATGTEGYSLIGDNGGFIIGPVKPDSIGGVSKVPILL
jgi:hypothetical protein